MPILQPKAHKISDQQERDLRYMGELVAADVESVIGYPLALVDVISAISEDVAGNKTAVLVFTLGVDITD